MPRKSVEQGIGEVIKDLFKAYHIDDKVYAIRIGDVWEEVMGKTVARYTTGIRLEKDVLHIRIDSAPLRQELFFTGMISGKGSTRLSLKRWFVKSTSGEQIAVVQRVNIL